MTILRDLHQLLSGGVRVPACKRSGDRAPVLLGAPGSDRVHVGEHVCSQCCHIPGASCASICRLLERLLIFPSTPSATLHITFSRQLVAHDVAQYFWQTWNEKSRKKQKWSATDFPIQRIGADGPTIHTQGYAKVIGPSHVSTKLRKHLDSKSGQRKSFGHMIWAFGTGNLAFSR